MNEQLWSLLEAAEVSTDRTTTSHTVSEDINDSDEYVTKAEDTLFEISRYLDNHPADVNPVVSIAASVSSSAKGHTISFRAMTHDDCRLWFAQPEDVFASLGISSQANKFAALTTLLTGPHDGGRRTSVQRFRRFDGPVRQTLRTHSSPEI